MLRVCANSFENVLDGYIFTVAVAGRNGSAIEHEPRQVEPRQRHHGAWDGFVAAHNRDYRVEVVTARH